MKSIMSKRVSATDLFVQPGFFRDMARIADMTGYIEDYNSSNSGTEADCKALDKDYWLVMNDINDATRRYEKARRQVRAGNSR